MRLALSLVHALAWVLVFEYFYRLSGSMSRALAGVVILYGFSQLITLIATPIAAAHLSRGTRRSLAFGALVAACAFSVLGATYSGYFDAPMLTGVALFAVLLGLYRALYWIPYVLVNAEVHRSAHMHTYTEVLLALMPLLAGLTMSAVENAPARLLFGAAAILVLSSFLGYATPQTRERFSWPYVYTFAQLFRAKNRGLVLHAMLEGMQGAVLFLVWPLAIFLIVEWSYLMFGTIFSITLLSILLLRKTHRWFTRLVGIHDSPIVHTVVAVSGWIARLAAGTPVGIIVADVYSYSTLPERGTRTDLASFEHASDHGAFLDEYTALKEIALSLGRIMLATLIFFLLTVFTLPIVFAIALGVAAAASAIAVMVARRGIAPAY